MTWTCTLHNKQTSPLPCLCRCLVFALVIQVPAICADTFTEGGDAYKAGDYTVALAKFTEVAERGDHRAMYALGSMYAGGTGVEQDFRQAYKWFSEAASYGRTDAQYKLGLMYELGVGVKQDYRRAARFYRDVGRKGYAHGQFKFGQLYLQGHGVEQDLVKAYAWMSAANANFTRSSGVAVLNEGEPAQSSDLFAVLHQEIIEAELKEITTKLSAADLAQAQELAREYMTYR